MLPAALLASWGLRTAQLLRRLAAIYGERLQHGGSERRR
jgi:hypothetical protein